MVAAFEDDAPHYARPIVAAPALAAGSARALRIPMGMERPVFPWGASGLAPSIECCPATQQALVDAWGRSGVAGFFGESLLQIRAGAHAFISWLHQRPELSGAAWKPEACQLVVTPRHSKQVPFRFNVLDLKRGRLRLHDESAHRESVTVRLPDES